MAAETATGDRSSVKVAALQMTSGNDVAQNLLAADALVREASATGAAMAVLPENFAFMGKTDAERIAIAETPGDGMLQTWLQGTAKQHGIWLVGGTIPLAADNGRCFSSCFVVDDVGEVRARYDKRHLFDVSVPGSDESYLESRNTVAGGQTVVCASPLGVLGLSICYDLRFPEHFRSMLDAGMQAIVVPAAFTRPTGDAHWAVLLRSRAIENLCPVIAAAQCGTHAGGRQTWGHSMIVDPWGKVLATCTDQPGLAVAELNMVNAQKTRGKFPVLEHRNP